MQLLIPQTPWELAFQRDNQEGWLSIQLQGNDWVASWTLGEENPGPENEMLRAPSWLELFKKLDKWMVDTEKDQWVCTGEGFKVPLFVKEGSADKEYHAFLKQEEGSWSCRCLYGRRGSALKNADKKIKTPFAQAWKAFREVVHEKVKDGYQLYVEGVEYQSGTQAGQIAGMSVQLLTESADVESLLKDDDYWMEEKFDGERRPIWKQNATTVVGMNRNAYQVPLHRGIEGAVLATKAESIQWDGEDLGGKWAVFDILSLNGEDLRQKSFKERKDILNGVLADLPHEHRSAIVPVYTAKTTEEKKALLLALKARNAEGVVFKRKNSAYKAGKQLDGDQIKVKFYEECSVVVTAVNDKRSVQVGVYTENNVLQSIGNVTIGGTLAIPQAGEVIEVKYLYAYREGSLYQPSYKMKRTDVNAEQCTIKQLKYKADYDYAQEQWERILGGDNLTKPLKMR